MVALCVIHIVSFLGHEVWSYAPLCPVDSEWVTSIPPPISAYTFSSIFQWANEQTGLTQNQLDTVVHMTIFRVQVMKKYEWHIVQPSRTNDRLEIYSAGTISTNQFGTGEPEALCICAQSNWWRCLWHTPHERRYEICALHGIGHESRAPNPNTSKYGVGIGGKFIEVIELIRITILFVRTDKLLYPKRRCTK